MGWLVGQLNDICIAIRDSGNLLYKFNSQLIFTVHSPAQKRKRNGWDAEVTV